MGRNDAASKNYLSKNEVFADAVNYHFFGGRQVVRPEDLREQDRRNWHCSLERQEMIPVGAGGEAEAEGGASKRGGSWNIRWGVFVGIS